jgi:hypothetical protein
LAFNVVLHVESRKKIWSISLTLPAHFDLLSFVDDFKVGSSIALGNIWRGSRREYKEFKMQTPFFCKQKQDEIDIFLFILGSSCF